MPGVLGTVASLYRFPVKSMRGELLERAALGPAGLDGDREWALLDDEDHWVSAKTNRGRWRLSAGMLDIAATTVAATPARAARTDVAPSGGTDEAAVATTGAACPPSSTVVVALPDGRTVRAGTPEADAVLSAHLGRELRFDHGDAGRRWGRHHDAAPLHLVTTATLQALHSDGDGAPGERDALDPLRLRPNLVVRTPDGTIGFAEDAWVGATLRIGGALLRVTETTGRCVMTTREQAGLLPRDATVLKRIGRRNGADAGIYLAVLEPGTVAVGDALRVVAPPLG